MNQNILNTGVQEFINGNWNTDIVSVLLKRPISPGISQKELVEQLEAKKKCRNKLPTWFNTPNIYYPNKLNIEQTSSEKTARYKAGLVKGKTLLDTTGGLGVDSYFFSQKIGQVFHCEVDRNLSDIARHNFKVLGINNCTCISESVEDFLRNSSVDFDWIYMDPSRRDFNKGKVFLLKDCVPNVPELLEELFERTSNFLLKTSPLLDISQGLSELKFVKEVHVVAVKNEVKELLWIMEKGFEGEVVVRTINIKLEQNELFHFNSTEERKASTKLENPLAYLYEPNSAVLKSGGFKILASKFGLSKLHEHSHLYTSDEKIDFPGRVFKVKKAFPYSKKGMKDLGLAKANITTRNFPESVDSLRKKHKIKEGGNNYLFFTTDKNNDKTVVHCTKI